MFQCSHILYKCLMLFGSCIAPGCTLLSHEFYRLAVCCAERESISFHQLVFHLCEYTCVLCCKRE